MKCIILAAGYATRLYPLTENFPKPLLKVGEKAILDWLVDDISSTGKVDEFIVVSNHKFFEHFKTWADKKQQNVLVLDDLTTSNENRLGAVKDIQFAIEKTQIDDDILVVAGDNITDFSFEVFIDYFTCKNASCIMRYYEQEKSVLQKCGVMKIKDDDLVTELVEKPSEPASNWGCPPFYIYHKRDIPLIKKGIEDGCAVDAPGSFVAWLCQNAKVYAMEMPGNRFDIGDLESYNQVQKIFEGIR